MGVALLDVSALLALLVEDHEFHDRMARWYAANQGAGWATCPITEQGFVRVVSNAGYLRPAAKVAEALRLLRITIEASAFHEFWPDDYPLSDLIPSVRTRLVGPKQITDAYLLCLSIRRKGRLVTLDRRILQLAPDGSAERASLEVLP